MRCTVIASVSVAVVVALSVQSPGHCASNWPMWLENPAHRPTARYPVNTHSSLPWINWEVECGGIFGSPVVYGGAVYFASRDGCLCAVDDRTGKFLWMVRITVPGSELPQAMEIEGRYCTYRETGLLATPAVDARAAYIGGLGGEFCACARDTGKLLWEQDLEAAISSSALLIHNLVVVGTRGGDLVAMDREGGSVVWTFSTHGQINSSPAYADGKVIVGRATDLVAVDARDGEPIWAHRVWPEGDADSCKIDASPCIAGERVYAATWDGRVLAVGLQDGRLIWQRRIARAPIFASPAVGHGLVFATATDGTLVALDAESGDPAWQFMLTYPSWHRGRVGAYASPVVCGDFVLAGCNGGALHMFQARTGEWVHTHTKGLYQFVHGTPTVTDTAIYVSSEYPYAPVRGAVTKLTPWHP